MRLTAPLEAPGHAERCLSPAGEVRAMLVRRCIRARALRIVRRGLITPLPGVATTCTWTLVVDIPTTDDGVLDALPCSKSSDADARIAFVYGAAHVKGNEDSEHR